MLKKLSKVIVLLFLITISLNMYGIDKLLRKKVSIQVSNQPMLEVLHQIEKQADITFSYSSNLFNKKELITINVKNTPISKVLDQLFEEKPISYKEIGSQIVLYTDKSKKVEKKNVPPQIKPSDTVDSVKIEVEQKTEPQIVEKIVNDTIYRYIKTINTYDTIHYIYYDTVKPSQAQPNINIELGYGIGIYSSKISINNDLYKYQKNVINKAETPALTFYLYSLIHTKFENKKISWGIKLSSYREQSNYQINEPYTIPITKIIRTWQIKLDTVYYKVNIRPGVNGGKDTSWYFVYRRIPIDKEQIVTSNDTLKLDSSVKNKYLYISFPIYFGIEKEISHHFSANFEIGPSIDLLLRKSGQILDPKKMELIDYKELSFLKWNISLNLNIGLIHSLENNNAFIYSIFIERGLQSIFTPGYPISKFNRSIGFKLGYIFR